MRPIALVLMIASCGRFGFGERPSSDASTVTEGPSDGPAAIDAGFGSVQHFLKASNTAPNSEYGYAVALSEDGNTLAVSAIDEASAATGINGNETDVSALNAGAVYVYARTGATWTKQAYLKASHTNPGAVFGVSLGISEDGSTLAVGATGESSNATGIDGNQANSSEADAGAAYVFVRVGTTWTQQAYVKASNTAVGVAFGYALALAGDGNTLAVSAIFEASSAVGINGNQADMSASESGATYVFVRAGTTWTQQAYVKASNTNVDDEFGGSVALSGDGNTLAIAAFAESSAASGVDGNQADNTKNGAGAVYVYKRAGATWAQDAYVKASNPSVGGIFGIRVALSQDATTLAVGSRDPSNATGINGNQADSSAPSAGAVYVFDDTAEWAQVAYLKASNTDANDHFGDGLAIDSTGDIVVVGAPGESSSAIGIGGDGSDNSAANSGAAYVFSRAASTWSQRFYVKASNTGAADQFGLALATSGFGTTIVVGAIGEDSATTGIDGQQNDSDVNSGAAYLYEY